MWGTRNERKKLDDFMKDAGLRTGEGLEKALPSEVYLESQYTPTESKLKKVKEVESADLKPFVEPKKVKRLQKNAAKEEEAKQRCDKASHLQKQLGFDKLQSRVSNASLFAKPKEPENDYKTLSISTLQITSKENGVDDKLPQTLYRYPASVNRSYHKFFGYLGHCTVLTETPVIEGSYYIEITILPNNTQSLNRNIKDLERQLQSSIKYSVPVMSSSVRVGIAKRNYKLLTALGGADSYCYNGKDAKLLHDRQYMDNPLQSQSFGAGDVVGMYFHMEPPLPTDKNDKIPVSANEGSVLVILKNGKEMAVVRDIEQGFYVFGVTLYNWANVEFNEGPDFKYPSPFQAKPYSSARQQNLPYKDLKFD